MANRMSPEANRRASAKYSAAHVTKKTLNLYDGTDADILAHLASMGNIQGYIKRLIREDIKRGEHTMNIYYAPLTATTTDGELQMGEISTADYGEEWNGDVAGYLDNALEDPDVRPAPLGSIQQNFGSHAPAGDVLAVYVDDSPREIWWAST